MKKISRWLIFSFSLVIFSAGYFLAQKRPVRKEETNFPQKEVRGFPNEGLTPIQVKKTWPEAVKLIENCQVLELAQTHNKSVGLGLKNGEFVFTVEPEIDDVLALAKSASEKCGFEIKTVTE